MGFRSRSLKPSSDTAGFEGAGGAARPLSDSYQLDMTRPQRIAVTAFLSALFVPSLFPLLMGLSAPGNAKGDRRLGQKKTLESWLQGRLPFIRESLGSSVTRPPLDDRQKSRWILPMGAVNSSLLRANTPTWGQ